MAVTFSNIHPWEPTAPYETRTWAISGGVTEFSYSPGLRTVENVLLNDDTTLGTSPVVSISAGVVTVTGLTTNGTGVITAFGSAP